MVKISYVFPSMRQGPGQFRSGLLTRYEEAVPLGCRYLEVPANGVRNIKEEKQTGICVCEMLTGDAIEKLYTPADTVPDDLEYILHTDPSFHQRGLDGVTHPAADLRWHDGDWLQRFCEMQIAISEYLGAPASIIEIHPGSNRSVSMKDIARAMQKIRQVYGDHFGGVAPRIVLENRTGSLIENGRQLREFWMAMQEHTPELARESGIVLDFSALFSTAGKRNDSFEDYLTAVPVEGIVGLHVHTRHQAPSADDALPWDVVFEKVAAIPHDFFINPEIHHKNKVGETIAFCERYLNSK